MRPSILSGLIVDAPSWQVTPSDLPAGRVYSGGSVRSQVNADGTLGYGPHNLLLYSDNLTAVAAWNATLLSVTAAAAHNGRSTWSLAKTTAATGDFLVQAVSASPGNVGFSISIWGAASTLFRCRVAVIVAGGAAVRQCTIISGPGNVRAGSNNTILENLSASVPTVAYVFAPHTTGSCSLFVNGGDGAVATLGASVRVQFENCNVGPQQTTYYPTTTAAYYGLRVADYSDSIGTANVRPGFKIEPAETNLFLNSLAPATQNITVTAQAYTLSCYGTGSIVLSGTSSGTLNGSGSATVRATRTFTPTAGTLTLTVTGTAKVQLEPGLVASSYIATSSSQISRNADLLAFSSVTGQGDNGMFVLDIDPTGSSAAQTILRNRQTPANGDLRVYLSNATTLIVEKVGTGTLTTHTVTAGGPIKMAVGFSSLGVRSCVNGGAVLTSVTTVNSTSGVTLGNDGAGGSVFNGSYYSVQHSVSVISDEAMQALTV